MAARFEGRRLIKPGRTALTIVLVGVVGGGLIARSLPQWGARVGTAARAGGAAGADPWAAAQTVEPAALAKELVAAPASRPTVVCVGFQSLYRNGHVTGASFHGPASGEQGLADLKRWAAALPHTTNIVLYCGCCPLTECPNVRPAFTALHDMGFTHVRVLLLPNNFGTDWAARGYPVER